jgi:hypothetical protein
MSQESEQLIELGSLRVRVDNLKEGLRQVIKENDVLKEKMKVLNSEPETVHRPRQYRPVIIHGAMYWILSQIDKFTKDNGSSDWLNLVLLSDLKGSIEKALLEKQTEGSDDPFQSFTLVLTGAEIDCLYEITGDDVISPTDESRSIRDKVGRAIVNRKTG